MPSSPPHVGVTNPAQTKITHSNMYTKPFFYYSKSPTALLPENAIRKVFFLLIYFGEVSKNVNSDTWLSKIYESFNRKRFPLKFKTFVTTVLIVLTIWYLRWYIYFLIITNFFAASKQKTSLHNKCSFSPLNQIMRVKLCV